MHAHENEEETNLLRSAKLLCSSAPGSPLEPTTMSNGTPKAGVKTYPFSNFERLYRHEGIEDTVAARLTHPCARERRAQTSTTANHMNAVTQPNPPTPCRYLATFSPAGALPFNVLSNSASPESASHWQSESTRAFQPKSLWEAKNAASSGVRTEQTN